VDKLAADKSSAKNGAFKVDSSKRATSELLPERCCCGHFIEYAVMEYARELATLDLRASEIDTFHSNCVK
jgi:hypothetical protein